VAAASDRLTCVVRANLATLDRHLLARIRPGELAREAAACCIGEWQELQGIRASRCGEGTGQMAGVETRNQPARNAEERGQAGADEWRPPTATLDHGSCLPIVPAIYGLAPLLTLLPIGGTPKQGEIKLRRTQWLVCSPHQKLWAGALASAQEPDARRTPSKREDRSEKLADDHRLRSRTKRKPFAGPNGGFTGKFPPGCWW